jgi:hypothetical protein
MMNVMTLLIFTVPFILSAVKDVISGRIIQAGVKGVAVLSLLSGIFLGTPAIISLLLRGLIVVLLIVFAVKDIVTLKVFHAASNVILALLLVAPIVLGFLLNGVIRF